MPKTAALATSALTPVLSNFYATRPSLPDGIYLNLTADRYHEDTALGSSQIRDLLKGANLYWHKSLNPKRKKEKRTPAKILGTATHRLLLDGEEWFEAEYVRGPWGSDDEDLTSAEKGALTKAAKKNLLEGQELLPQDDYDFVVGCKQVIDDDPELQGCLDNGLSEVSVFWTRRDGIRCKARLDKLKLRGIGDIKTIANEKERPLEDACLLDIHTYRYDIPAEHYMEGRRQMAALFTAGKVFIEVDDEKAPEDKPARKIINLQKEAGELSAKTLTFLKACVEQKTFAFQLVFIPKKGAPDAWSCVLSPGNDLLTAARGDIDVAIGYFRKAMETFGPDKRWLPGHAVTELTADMLPIGFGRQRRLVR